MSRIPADLSASAEMLKIKLEQFKNTSTRPDVMHGELRFLQLVRLASGAGHANLKGAPDSHCAGIKLQVRDAIPAYSQEPNEAQKEIIGDLLRKRTQDEWGTESYHIDISLGSKLAHLTVMNNGIIARDMATLLHMAFANAQQPDDFRLISEASQALIINGGFRAPDRRYLLGILGEEALNAARFMETKAGTPGANTDPAIKSMNILTKLANTAAAESLIPDAQLRSW